MLTWYLFKSVFRDSVYYLGYLTHESVNKCYFCPTTIKNVYNKAMSWHLWRYLESVHSVEGKIVRVRRDLSKSVTIRCLASYALSIGREFYLLKTQLRRIVSFVKSIIRIISKFIFSFVLHPKFRGNAILSSPRSPEVLSNSPRIHGVVIQTWSWGSRFSGFNNCKFAFHDKS